jgi:hypothetical protein
MVGFGESVGKAANIREREREEEEVKGHKKINL